MSTETADIKHDPKEFTSRHRLVGLDGTLVASELDKGAEHIGHPIGPMLDRVRKMLADGQDVRILTGRIFPLTEFENPNALVVALQAEGMPPADRVERVVAGHHIRQWCEKHLGRVLPITCRISPGVSEIWACDAVGVLFNKGVDREVMLQWHLKRVIDATGIKLRTGDSFAAAADHGAARISAIVKSFDDAKAHMDAAADALGYVKGQNPEDDARNVRHAAASMQRAIKALNLPTP